MYDDHGWCVLVNRIAAFYLTHARIDVHSILCLVRKRLIPRHCATELHNHHAYQTFCGQSNRLAWPIPTVELTILRSSMDAMLPFLI